MPVLCRFTKPNPFNPSTTIIFSLPQAGIVNLKIYNLLGEEVKTLIAEERQAGNHSVQFNANNLASGFYFYKLQAGSFVETKKMILLK
ncbi:MAG: T9SS type A sorting domain-containing protein [Ignavibacteria bacterium]|nr:T9SS type A sorting domain-containing protein [Ignavibacteria bacterium]